MKRILITLFGFVFIIASIVLSLVLPRMLQTLKLGTKPKASSTALVNKNKYKKGEIIVKFGIPIDSYVLNGRQSDLDRSSITFKNLNLTKIPAIKMLVEKYQFATLNRVFKTIKLNAKSKTARESNVYVIAYQASDSVDSVIRELSAQPEVAWAEPNYIYEGSSTPNDPYFLDEYPANVSNRDPNWNPSFDYQWDLKKIHMPQAWDLVSSNNTTINVAVVDTGVDCTVLELVGKCLPGTDLVNNDMDPMDDNGHGTHVAGTIAANSNNSFGISGLNPNARIIPVKVLDQQGAGTNSNVSAGIIEAVDRGANIINLSLGLQNYSIPQSLKIALDYSYTNGVTVVSASGNSNDDIEKGYWPANYPTVISVGATDNTDLRASFSNFGTSLTVTAPGGAGSELDGDNLYGKSILSLRSNNYGNPVDIGGGGTVVGQNFVRARGTSMSAPHVSGLASLIMQKNLSLSNQPDLVKNVIANGADDLGVPGFDIYFGFGRINAERSLQDMNTASLPVAFISEPGLSATVNPVNGVTIKGTATATSFTSYTLEYTELATSVTKLISQSTNQVTNNTLGYWKEKLPDGSYSLILTVYYEGNKKVIYKRNIVLDSSMRVGWPIYVGARVYEAPAVADLNRDGKKEIITGDFYNGTVAIYNPDGTKFAPWPDKVFSNSKISNIPAVGNLDADPDLEFIVAVYSIDTGLRSLYAFNFDGTQVQGIWPITSPNYITGNVTLADLNNDGKDEIIGTIYNSPGTLMVWNSDATVFPGNWPAVLDSPAYFEYPAVANLDNDSLKTKEIVVQSSNHLSVFRTNGEKIFSSKLGKIVNSSLRSPVLADLDGNGTVEIVALNEINQSSWNLGLDGYEFTGSGFTRIFQINTQKNSSIWGFYYWISPSITDFNSDAQLDILLGNEIFATNGAKLASFPFSSPYYANTVSGDVDGDGKNEYFAQTVIDNSYSNSPPHLYGWRNNGTSLPGFPKPMTNIDMGIGLSMQLNIPVISDLDGDNKSELIVTSGGFLMVYDVSQGVTRGAYDFPAAHHDKSLSGYYQSNKSRWSTYGPKGNPSILWNSADKLLNTQYNSGVAVTEIDRWLNGGWNSYIRNFPFNKYQIEAGKGYLIKFFGDVNEFPNSFLGGYTPLSEIRISFTQGWNFISIPENLLMLIPKQGTELTAEDLCVSANIQQGGIFEVDEWSIGANNSNWAPHVCGYSDNNFVIKSGLAYFVKSSKTSSWLISQNMTGVKIAGKKLLPMSSKLKQELLKSRPPVFQ